MKNQYHKGESLYPDLIWASNGGQVTTFDAFGQFWLTEHDGNIICFRRLGPADDYESPTSELLVCELGF